MENQLLPTLFSILFGYILKRFFHFWSFIDSFTYFSFLPLFLRIFNPRWLNLFICVVEFLSIIIRPLTLSLRIAYSITVGHILIGLAFSYSSSLYISLILCFGLILVIFEIFVCLIQAYVFSNLVSLFCSPTSSREKDRYH